MSQTYWAGEPDLNELRRLHKLLAIDPERAIDGLVSLANRRSLMSMWYLAEAFMGPDAPKDILKAKYWYGRAEEVGSPEASFMLGRICLQQGELSQAFVAFSRSASKGYMPAIYRLAKMYEDGAGTNRDLSQYRNLLEEAASKGHFFAKRDLATQYVRGAYGPMLVLRGLQMFGSLGFELIRLFTRAVKRGPSIDERLIG